MTRSAGVLSSIVALLGVALIAAAVNNHALAQQNGNMQSAWQQQRILGELDNDVAAPLRGYVSPRSSSPASPMPSESTEWKGLEAAGTITYGNTSLSQPAILAISPSGSERLDVTLESGVRSLRIIGSAGKLQDPSGARRQLPSRNAVVSFIPIRAFSNKAVAADTVVSDMTAATLAGHLYTHKRYEFHPADVADPTKQGRPAFATEVYIAQSTGDVFKTVDYVESLEPSPEPHVRVITYENYKMVDGVRVPMNLTETIDGQIAFAIKLTSIQLSSARANSDFSF